MVQAAAADPLLGTTGIYTSRTMSSVRSAWSRLRDRSLHATGELIRILHHLTFLIEVDGGGVIGLIMVSCESGAVAVRSARSLAQVSPSDLQARGT